MKNITIPMTTWQLTLSALGCATSAPTAPNAALATLCAAVDAVATDVPAVKRERAFAGTGHRGHNAVFVPGFPAWSPPI